VLRDRTRPERILPAPDVSLKRAFFAVNSSANGSYSNTVDSIEAFDNNTYLPSESISLAFGIPKSDCLHHIQGLI